MSADRGASVLRNAWARTLRAGRGGDDGQDGWKCAGTAQVRVVCDLLHALAKYRSGVLGLVEGINNRVEAMKRMAHGYRDDT